MKRTNKTKQPQVKKPRAQVAALKQPKTERKRAERALSSALKEDQQRQAEISALLEGSRAVLKHREFKDAARAIFDSCKNLIGAAGGYVALLNPDGTENDVLFLDSGGRVCTVDPLLPMPIRGLRGEAYRLGKAVYDNDFSKSEWVEFVPQGHVTLDNVLFAPLVIEGKTVGLLGLANKPGGFTENDAHIASAFGELAAIALLNSRMLESLEHSEERFHSITQSASDAIICDDPRGNIVFWNRAAETMFGYSADEVLGKPVNLLMPERLREAHQKGMQRVVSTGESSIIGGTVESVGLRKDGTEFPIELSLAKWQSKEGAFFTAIARDITERKRAEEEYSTIISTAMDGFWSTDIQGRFLDVNDAYCRMIGYSRAELLKMGVQDVEAAEKAEKTAQHIQKVIETGYDCFETFHRCKDGSIIAIEVSANYMPGDSGRFFVFLRDITERKRAEEALRQARDELEIRVQERTAELAQANEALRSEIAERKRAEEEIQRNYDTQTVLNTLLRLSLEDISLDEILKRALDLVLSIPWLASQSRGSIALVEDTPDVLVMKAQNNLAEPIQKACARIPFGKCLCGRAALTQEVQFADCLDDRHEIHYEGISPHGHYCVPILFAGKMLGVMNIYLETGHRYDQREVNFLTAIADVLAGIIQRKRVEQELRHRLAELEAVNKISTALRVAQTLDEMLPRLLDETLAALDTDAGIIWLYDAARDEIREALARGWFKQIAEETPIKIEGIAKHVLATGEAYVAREFVSDPRTREVIRSQIPAGWGGACVPIHSTQESVGVLFVAVPLPRELRPAELRLLTTLVEIAGNAIHRMRLHAQTEQRLQRLTALHTTDQAISASLDLRLTLNVLLDQVTTQLRVDAADVLLLNPHMQTLEYAAGRGFRSQAIERSRLRLGEGHAGRAALERRIIHIPNLPETGKEFVRAELLSGEAFQSYCAAPLIIKGQDKGILEVFHRAPLDPDPEWLSFLETLAGQAAIAIDNITLFNDLRNSNANLRMAYDGTIEGWSRALDLRDKETEGHSQRVTEMTEQLARAMGMSEEQLVHVRRGALLHDIGKMGVPDGILLKPGPLTDEEWVEMRKHPVYAYEMLSPIAYLRPALDIPYCHHEKWDGAGYPRGLKGEQIPLVARIFAVVDVWDALRSDRPYRAAWPEEQVREHIRAGSGTHFDPKVVEMFLRVKGGG